jgi:hypothetical protein
MTMTMMMNNWLGSDCCAYLEQTVDNVTRYLARNTSLDSYQYIDVEDSSVTIVKQG